MYVLKQKTDAKIFTFLLLLTFSFASMEAIGWGKNETTVQYGDTTWNGVYCDFNGMKLSALVPNCSGSTMSNGLIEFNGEVDQGGGYVISTSYNPGFNPPKTAKEFVKMIQDANPYCTVVIVDIAKIGGRYAVDLIPKDPVANPAYWRFLATNGRLIKMGTDDKDSSRRAYFFKSISIR